MYVFQAPQKGGLPEGGVITPSAGKLKEFYLPQLITLSPFGSDTNAQ